LIIVAHSFPLLANINDKYPKLIQQIIPKKIIGIFTGVIFSKKIGITKEPKKISEKLADKFDKARNRCLPIIIFLNMKETLSMDYTLQNTYFR